MDDSADERRERKREYIRHFMQGYRDKQRKSKQVLQAQIECEQVLAELKEWMAMSTIHATPSTHRTSWRDFTLLAHPTSRRLGKQWITQQMYHNLDRAFMQHGMPPPHPLAVSSPDNMHHSMDLEFSDDGHCFVQKAQKIWPLPLETVVALFRRHTGSMFTLDAFTPVHSQIATEEDGNTTLHVYPPCASGGFSFSLLCGEFHSHDRTVLVIQQLQGDEAIPTANHHRLRKRMVWIELRRESPTSTYERILNITWHDTTPDGVDVSLDELAARWGVDLGQVTDDAEKERRLVLGYRARNKSLVQQRKQWYAELVHMTIQQQQQQQQYNAHMDTE
ncbi:hypothetical protein DYB30_013001 [Aphanomyces astaci]|uniref:Uncharacterized protein n=1 Tax=Aphanomyces astaci TaxID=112090 RepID=A0A397EAJ1_APHAT|nr:hypothetical protein DYB34_012820 [Aphanomyces astaci]RHY79095.1 hypothetical protein DYB30_013001 [Aphanomyces astaci]RHZ31797.1 hypothetical protein DYB26_010633 [Aphanomyces astaci]